jgi:hypothetical protein
MNEKIKTYNSDKYKIYGDIMGHVWDNGHSINYSATGGGEINNNILIPTNIYGLAPLNMPNTAHVQRCMKSNIDITKKANSSLNNFLCSVDPGENINPLRDNEHQNALVFSDINTLVFQGVAIIPLSQLHPVFEKMPTVSSVGFELRLQCNMAKENTYSMTYPAMSTNVVTLPSSINVVQSIGKICPVMVSSPSINGVTGIKLNGNQASNGILNVKCMIGWNVDINGVGFKGTTGPPCRIHLPTISFTSNYLKDIAISPQCSLRYNDYYVDSDLNQKQGSNVSRLFNTNLTRPRILYVIPFLAQSVVATKVYPAALTSPLSSAPITCTPARLRNFNIQIGGQNLFSEPQQFNYSFYNSNAMSILADINGNSPKSALFSGQISKSQWENGYNVYYVNLEKVSDIITDSTMKAFQLTYSIDGSNSDVFYDMYYIISYENEVNLDRLTGKITGINQ